MSVRASFVTLFIAAAGLLAQNPAPGQEAGTWRKADHNQSDQVVVESGTRIPLTLLNSVSSKHSAEGDRLYLETIFPIVVNGRIVIPPGSYVAGTVTQVKRPGRVKGRGELFVRFDSLTLPNGVTRDFRARVGNMDGQAGDELDRREGKIKSEGHKAGDAATIGGAAATGATIGTLAGGAAGRYGMGAGIGAAAGATAGLMGVLLSRGPDAVLAKGTTVEMVLDRPLKYQENELNFGPMRPVPVTDNSPKPAKKNGSNILFPRRPFPY